MHKMGVVHPESPGRLYAIQEGLKNSGIWEKLIMKEAPRVSPDLLPLIHSEEHLEHLYRNAPEKGLFEVDPDTLMNQHTVEAAWRAAGSSVLAVDMVLDGDVEGAFCSVRPPGHHAERSRAMGFCFMNNVALAAAYALEKRGLDRVAIIDFDVHHGNGTEDILKDEKRILMCSIFRHPFFPGTGWISNQKNMKHVPLDVGSASDRLFAAVEEVWLPALKEFHPELIVFSAGFDAHEDDPIGGMKFKTQDFAWVTQKVMEVAEACGHQRVVSTLEGGYDLSALGQSTSAHLSVLLQS